MKELTIEKLKVLRGDYYQARENASATIQQCNQMIQQINAELHERETPEQDTNGKKQKESK